MNWINTTEEQPPANEWVLVQYKRPFYLNERVYSYDALQFRNDAEYGFVASTCESYVDLDEVEKWCLIS